MISSGSPASSCCFAGGADSEGRPWSSFCHEVLAELAAATTAAPRFGSGRVRTDSIQPIALGRAVAKSRRQCLKLWQRLYSCACLPCRRMASSCRSGTRGPGHRRRPSAFQALMPFQRTDVGPGAPWSLWIGVSGDRPNGVARAHGRQLEARRRAVPGGGAGLLRQPSTATRSSCPPASKAPGGLKIGINLSSQGPRGRSKVGQTCIQFRD